MAINLRIRVVAAFLPILWTCVQPSTIFAQLPYLEAIAAGKDTVNRDGLVQEQQPAPTTMVFDEAPRSSAFVRFFRDGEWYFSWGYSREWWARTNIHVSQPSQKNNFTIYDLRGTDEPGWDSFFGAQYNIRLGRFVDEARTVAVEFNFDHTKYSSVQGQTARIDGTIADVRTDTNYRLDPSFFTYNLHNGANHMMFNLVKRVPLIGEPNEAFSVAAIGKAGIGLMLPHPETVIMNRFGDVGNKDFNNMIGIHRGWWQADGWTTGIEAGFRVGLTKRIYLEITDKIAFARLGDVSVFQGTATHNLWMNEVILSVGISFGGGR